MASDVTNTEFTEDKRSLYERDYYTWALQQSCALKDHRLEDIDWDNLSDEVEGLAKTDRRELLSRLKVLLEHLLKWQFQAQRRSRSWRATIAVQRVEIRRHLAQNPGLRPSVEEAMAEAYEAPRVKVSIRFLRRRDPQPPTSCPWTFEQIMDEEFWPD
jgi:hypothetical protein